MWAFKGDNTDLAALLLEHGADANASDKNGWTPLMYAVTYMGTANAANLLIQHGANLNAKNRKGGTALAIAESAGRHEFAAVLRQHGATE